jgi:hypothetical protein
MQDVRGIRLRCGLMVAVVAAAVMLRRQRWCELLLVCANKSDEEMSLVESPRKVFDGGVQYTGSCIQHHKTISVQPGMGP